MSQVITPKRNPREFGFTKNDTHVIINAAVNTAKAYSFEGVLLWERPALADGMHENWKAYQGDTPPGLYRLGAIYNDYGANPNPGYDRTLAAYGWQTYDMEDLEGNEDNYGRAGICIHGGGSALGWPRCWDPYQPLVPTWGCIRMHNSDLLNSLNSRYRLGKVFVSVYQD